MTTSFIRNQPVGTDLLSVSQPYLTQNTNSSDSIFGFDHFAFSNNTTNQGFHQKVTTPLYSNGSTMPAAFSPPPTVAAPIFYAYTPLDTSGNTTTNLPVIQWSRGVSNAVPSPVTSLQSPSTAITINAGATSNVFDFTGIALAICSLYAFDKVANVFIGGPVFWNGTTISPFTNLLSTNLISQGAGAILQLKNSTGVAFSNIYWTLKFERIQ